jgi:hypothetical protein
MTIPPSSPGSAHLNFFSENVDAWGAAEWFNRLATAIRQQDAAVLANDDAVMEICRNVAASSAMRLVRDYEQQVRSALSGAAQGSGPPLIAWMMKDKKTGELKPYQDPNWKNTLPLTLYEPSELTKRQHEETGPYLVAKVEIKEVLEPQGTFACPICGLDSPHTHSAAEISAHAAILSSVPSTGPRGGDK